jgi:hypothetical protein
LQPTDCRRIHIVGSGNIGLRLAGSQTGKCLLPLMGIKLKRSTETNPTGLRALSALSGSVGALIHPISLGDRCLKRVKSAVRNGDEHFRFAPISDGEADIRGLRIRADIVAKLFCVSESARLIQDRAPMCNIDSIIPSLGFQMA